MLNKDGKKISCHHGVLALAIVALLGLILIALVFKVGMMVGMSKSYYSSCGAASSYKNFSGHLYKAYGAGEYKEYSAEQKKQEAE